jgi:hypothetical protein
LHNRAGVFQGGIGFTSICEMLYNSMQDAHCQRLVELFVSGNISSLKQAILIIVERCDHSDPLGFILEPGCIKILNDSFTRTWMCNSTQEVKSCVSTKTLQTLHKL